MIAFENKPEIGKGIYTLRDVATVLKMPYPKVFRWIRTYWDGRLGKKFKQEYSWVREGSRAVNFHTLVELYVMVQFAEKGLKTKDVLINLTKSLWVIGPCRTFSSNPILTLRVY